LADAIEGRIPRTETVQILSQRFNSLLNIKEHADKLVATPIIYEISIQLNQDTMVFIHQCR